MAELICITGHSCYSAHSCASKIVWGGVLHTSRGDLPARGYLNYEHQLLSSTFGELWAFSHVLETFRKLYLTGSLPYAMGAAE